MNLRNDIGLTIECSQCMVRESQYSTNPNIAVFEQALKAKGWGRTSFADDDTLYTCCPTCMKEVPEIKMH